MKKKLLYVYYGFVGFVSIIVGLIFITVTENNQSEKTSVSSNSEQQQENNRYDFSKVKTMSEFMSVDKNKRALYYLDLSDKMIKEQFIKVPYNKKEVSRLAGILDECMQLSYTKLNSNEFETTAQFCVAASEMEYK